MYGHGIHPNMKARACGGIRFFEREFFLCLFLIYLFGCLVCLLVVGWLVVVGVHFFGAKRSQNLGLNVCVKGTGRLRGSLEVPLSHLKNGSFNNKANTNTNTHNTNKDIG
jgi:hypothetical protein